MNKIIVEIFVPVLGESFDIFLPLQSQMYDVVALIKKAISELSDGQFYCDENTVLCYRNDGKMIDINLSVYELGLKTGSKLMLI